ncbi:PBP superfamily domain protein [uncultured archaeon]|nr:PBP superfamily domain protein [uncultured archaeon]
MIGDAINPCPPNFELKAHNTQRACRWASLKHWIEKTKENIKMVNTKGIRAFLHDAKAVSPAIATLILIVIAAVAAAGVGILVQSSQKNAQDQTGNKNLDVMGTINIKGSTTVMPITQGAAEVFMKKYPAVTINVGGGGSEVGQLLAWTTASPKEDIGASSSKWSTDDKTINGILIPKRATAIIQEAGESAKVFETKIGTGMIVLAGQNTMDIVNTTGCVSNTTSICYGDLKAAYAGTGQIGTTGLTVIQRSDKSGTEETFAAWIGLVKSDDKQLNSNVTGYQGNQGIRDAIASNPNLVGFVDVGFTGSFLNGNAKVVAATMNNTKAEDANKGVGKTYDIQSISLTGITDVTKQKGLARDLFYYNQGIPTGAIKTYLDWIMTPDGQKVVQNEGFFSI